jgi:hypothetical protein
VQTLRPENPSTCAICRYCYKNRRDRYSHLTRAHSKPTPPPVEMSYCTINDLDDGYRYDSRLCDDGSQTVGLPADPETIKHTLNGSTPFVPFIDIEDCRQSHLGLPTLIDKSTSECTGDLCHMDFRYLQTDPAHHVQRSGTPPIALKWLGEINKGGVARVHKVKAMVDMSQKHRLSTGLYACKQFSMEVFAFRTRARGLRIPIPAERTRKRLCAMLWLFQSRRLQRSFGVQPTS